MKGLKNLCLIFFILIQFAKNYLIFSSISCKLAIPPTLTHFLRMHFLLQVKFLFMKIYSLLNLYAIIYYELIIFVSIFSEQIFHVRRLKNEIIFRIALYCKFSSLYYILFKSIEHRQVKFVEREIHLNCDSNRLKDDINQKIAPSTAK